MKPATFSLCLLAHVLMLAMPVLAPLNFVHADEETSRAFAQDKAADLRIEWESDSRLFLRHPHTEEFKTEDTLFTELARIKTKHELAVVDIGKPMRKLSDLDLKQRVDMIEARIKKLGFKRVVFHLAAAESHPIYRE